VKWALKVAAKVVLARLPVNYALWRRLGLFRHGRMDRGDYALKIFRLHVQRAFPAGLPQGASVLELGPGDSIASALIAAGHGAGRVWLVDVGDFASKDVALYRALAQDLLRQGVAVPDLSQCTSVDDVLTACNASYLTEGLASFTQICDGSVDFIWSHSVLEHVRRAELQGMLAAQYRVLRPGGHASHNVDYQDHLDSALNNLRFSERLWESPLLAGAGFYTNRVPAVVMHRMFRQAGFELLQENFGRWPAMPTPRRTMAAEFAGFADQDLLQRTSHALLRRQR
jgi:SAM-dependent methyltransferase